MLAVQLHAAGWLGLLASRQPPPRTQAACLRTVLLCCALGTLLLGLLAWAASGHHEWG
jgi:hypothetical protein